MLVVFFQVTRNNIYIKLMQKRRLWRYAKFVLLTVSIVSIVGGAGTAMAVTSSSTHYQVTETEFGTGSSTLQSCSGQYCAQTSIGNVADGKSTSYGTTATFGEIASDEPILEVIIESGESNLGVLTTESTATKTTTVKVRNVMTSGYALQIVGSAPKFNGHTLATPTTPTASLPGTEQFAINVAANTVPNVGAHPVQVPAGQVIFGVGSENYRTSNLFMFSSDDVIARSLTETGRTDYTISMIVNISNSTPAGHYSGDFSAIVMPVY